ncbi:polysaccharide deacetylase family protein [Verrucomicrobiota bacterium]
MKPGNMGAAASGHMIRVWVGRVCHGLGLCRAARRVIGRRLAPILCYHRVCDEPRPLCTPVKLFDAHMRHLKMHYRPMSLSDYVGNLAAGAPVSDYGVVVTFDDGYRDAATTAWPILRHYGIPAVFFVTTDFADRKASPWWERVADAVIRGGGIEIGGRRFELAAGDTTRTEFAFRHAAKWLRDLPVSEREEEIGRLAEQAGCGPTRTGAGDMMMDWDDIRNLDGLGAEIGCHGMTHESPWSLSPGALRRELAGALARIGEELGPGRRALAFPYGYAGPPDAGTRQCADSLGYYCALSHSLLPGESNSDPFALGRLGVGRETLPQFAAKVSGLNLLFKRIGGAGR